MALVKNYGSGGPEYYETEEFLDLLSRMIVFNATGDHAMSFTSDVNIGVGSTPSNPTFSNLTVSGLTNLAGGLQVSSSAATFSSPVTVNGSTTLTVNGSTTLTGGLDVSGATAATFSSPLNVSGLTKLNGGLKVTGDAQVSSKLTVNSIEFANGGGTMSAAPQQTSLSLSDVSDLLKEESSSDTLEIYKGVSSPFQGLTHFNTQLVSHKIYGSLQVGKFIGGVLSQGDYFRADVYGVLKVTTEDVTTTLDESGITFSQTVNEPELRMSDTSATITKVINAANNFEELKGQVEAIKAAITAAFRGIGVSIDLP